MADREFSTIGHERLNNPRLQIKDREAFIRLKVSENHYQPPYFRLMERLNAAGGAAPPPVMRPRRLSLAPFRDCNADTLVDLPHPISYSSVPPPSPVALPLDFIYSF